MLMWAFALALALRCYTESVMTDYYLWPALALALVVAARCSNARFVIAIVAAIATTVTAQWHYSWLRGGCSTWAE
jgi:glycerol uptake facilitator-like aquaporin